MMTSTPKSGALLDGLLAATAPIIAGALAGGADPGWLPIARLYLSPFRVDCAFYDVNGIVRGVWRAAGDPALVELTAQFLNGGLASLPDAQRRAAVTFLSCQLGTLLALVDPLTRAAGGALMPADDIGEPALLFVLRHDDIDDTWH